MWALSRAQTLLVVCGDLSGLLRRGGEAVRRRLTKSTLWVVSLVRSGRDRAMRGRGWDGGSMLGPSLEESHMPDLLTVIPVALGVWRTQLRVMAGKA